MKRIIDGLLYDTDRAQKLCDYIANEGYVDYVSEALYKTKKGRYFLAGESGECGRYAFLNGLGRSTAGEGIVPLDEYDVMQYLVKHNFVDIYIELFGEPEGA